MFSTNLDQVVGQVLIKCSTLCIESGILIFGNIEQFLHRHVVPLPIGPEIALEELNGIALGIGEKQMTLDGRCADRTKVEDRCKVRAEPAGGLGHVYGVAFRKHACGYKVRCGMRRDNRGGILILRNCQMEVTPVDAEIVTGTIEDVLVARSGGKNIQARGMVAERHYLLTSLVDRNHGIHFE